MFKIERMRSLMTLILFATIQVIADSSLSGKEHGDHKPGGENDEFVFAEHDHNPSDQYCEDNNQRCKVGFYLQSRTTLLRHKN